MTARLDESGRCVVSDLFPDQCACKDHRNVIPPVESMTYAVTAYTSARYDGTCSLNRSHKVLQGDKIAMAEGIGWICLGCAEDVGS